MPIARRLPPSSRVCKAVARSIWATASGGLTGTEQNRSTSGDGRPRSPRPLSLRCRSGSPAGSARAMGLTDWRGWQPKFGPEIGLRDLLDRFSYDCLWRAEARGKRGVSACGVYLPDLDQPRPPDLPARARETATCQQHITENSPMRNLCNLAQGQAEAGSMDRRPTATQASRNRISAAAASSANS